MPALSAQDKQHIKNQIPHRKKLKQDLEKIIAELDKEIIKMEKDTKD